MNRYFRRVYPMALVRCLLFLAAMAISLGAKARCPGPMQPSGPVQKSNPAQKPGSAQKSGPMQKTGPAPKAPPPSQNSFESEFPDGPGKARFLANCSMCHSPENVIGHGQDADGWTQTIYKMIQYGAQGSDQDFGAIVYYLSHNFGPPPDKVDVNEATSMDFRNWLLFTKQQADSIIAYRKQHGDFHSLADLKKVPEIDPKMIDADKNRLTF